MATGYRPTTLRDGTVIQGSMVEDPREYSSRNMNKFFLGIILDVYVSDFDDNRSAQQNQDRKGHRHECTILVTDDGNSGNLTLENVVITPDVPVGLNDYCEKLPQGSSNQIDGADYNVNLDQVDPYDLDGDWCVVGFIGGRIDSPFIVSWWPHARNVYDPATSGNGYDGEALVQSGRYFRRTNGVETIINSKGDIIISTTFTSATLAHGSDPLLGRYPMNQNPEVGGSIRINVKPSQSFEMDFNPQQDGIGVIDAPDPNMPQTNPPQSDPEAEKTGELPLESYVYIDRSQAAFYIPAMVTITTQDNVLVTATNFISLATEDYIDLTATNQITFEATKIYLGQAAENDEEDPVLLGEKMRAWFGSTGAHQILSPFGPLKVDPASLEAPYDDIESKKSFVE